MAMNVQNEMDNIALNLVYTWIEEHLDASDTYPLYQVYTVWKCKTLQNWKYLISSSLPDQMYYEVTFNGDKNEWYLDAYKKFDHKTIPDPRDSKTTEAC